MPIGKGGTLGDGNAVDKLSVGRDKGAAVETTPACTRRHAGNERDRRHTEMRRCLKNNLDRNGHLCTIVIYRLFILWATFEANCRPSLQILYPSRRRRQNDNVSDGDRLYKVPNNNLLQWYRDLL
jgi:hypothetical protein